MADVHPGPCRRGQGAGPPVPAGGFGPVRRGVLLDGHREDHQRLRGRARGRDRRVHRGYRGVERGPAGHRTAGLGFGHGIAGARRLRRLRGRAGTRLRLRRAERGCPRLADQAPGHRQPLADRRVFPRGDDPPRRPRDWGDVIRPWPPGRLAGDRYLAGPDQRGADRRLGARPAGRAVAAGPRPHTAPARAARGPRGPAAHAALAARPRRGGPAPHRPALHRSRPGHRGGRGVRLARPARRHAPPGTRRIPAAHAARHGAERDGSHPAQKHQPGAHQDGQAHDGRSCRPLAYRHRGADRPGRRPAAGFLGRGPRGRADGDPDQRADRVRRADQAADRLARRGGLGGRRRRGRRPAPAPGGMVPGCTAPGWPAPSVPSSTRCGTGCGRCTCSAPSAASAHRSR